MIAKYLQKIFFSGKPVASKNEGHYRTLSNIRVLSAARDLEANKYCIQKKSN
jgi:hypothetical protein